MTSSLRPLLARLVLLLPALLLMPAPGLAQETKPDAANAIQLFDGKSLDGWTHVGPGSFEVADGELHTSGGMDCSGPSASLAITC